MGLNDTREINLNGIITLDSKTHLTNWKLTTTSKIEDFEWSESPTILVAGKNVPITYIINPTLSMFKSKISKKIDEAINVQGSDKPEFKAKHLNGFTNNDFRVLITKTSIASMGMNYQNCHNMVFTSYDFKFEQFYQAVRRCYRFGQEFKVKVHLLIPESQTNVRQSILNKQENHFKMIREMAKYSAKNDYKKNKPQREYKKVQILTPNF